MDPTSSIMENLPYLMIIGGSLSISAFVAFKALRLKEDENLLKNQTDSNIIQNSQSIVSHAYNQNIKFSEDIGKTIIDKLRVEQRENDRKSEKFEKFVDIDSLIASNEAFCGACGTQILHKGHVREVLLLDVFKYKILYACVKCGNPITPPIDLKPNIDKEGIIRLERFLEEVEVKKPETVEEVKQVTEKVVEQTQVNPTPVQTEQERPKQQIEIKCGVCKFVKAEQVGNLTVYRCTGPGAPAIRKDKFLEKGLDTKACRWYAKYYRRGKVDELISMNDLGDSNDAV
ncbi:MAG: hypothetical protein QW290_08310 [Sulfolobales archaeon]